MGNAFATEQERFWAGEFGDAYSQRNDGEALIASNKALFARVLEAARGIRSVVELGCNIGLNLEALHRLDPALELRGYEINPGAAAVARARGIAPIEEATIVEPLAGGRQFDLAFTKTVLIHIAPERLEDVYRNLVALSSRYVLVCEYYNPVPVSVPYRGHHERLFKRDFAGELMDGFGMELADYGFVYKRDPRAPQDDVTWFLLERRA